MIVPLKQKKKIYPVTLGIFHIRSILSKHFRKIMGILHLILNDLRRKINCYCYIVCGLYQKSNNIYF